MGTVRDVKDLAEEIKLLMAQLLRTRSMRDPLADLSPELTSPQLHAIVALGLNGTLPMSVLAQRIHCAVPSASGVVDRLEREALVERERSADDRRLVLVGLTQKGRLAFSRLDEDMTVKLVELLTALEAADRELLVELMGRIVTVLGNRSQPPVPSEESHES